jgi:hypothetical protein
VTIGDFAALDWADGPMAPRLATHAAIKALRALVWIYGLRS